MANTAEESGESASRLAQFAVLVLAVAAAAAAFYFLGLEQLGIEPTQEPTATVDASAEPTPNDEPADEAPPEEPQAAPPPAPAPAPRPPAAEPPPAANNEGPFTSGTHAAEVVGYVAGTPTRLVVDWTYVPDAPETKWVNDDPTTYALPVAANPVLEISNDGTLLTAVTLAEFGDYVTSRGKIFCFVTLSGGAITHASESLE